MTSSWMLRILGDFALVRDGEVVDRFGARREEQVLAFLALDAAVPKRRDDLVAAIWPGVPLAHARKHLSFNLFVLRKRFAEAGLPDAVHGIGRTSLILDERLVIDAQRFDAALAAVAVAADDPDGLEEALALYGGPLLPTCPSPWLEAPRARYAELYQLALERVVEHAGVAGVRGSIAGQVSPAARGAAGGGRVARPAPVDAVPAPAPDDDLEALARDAEAGLSLAVPDAWVARVGEAYPRIEALFARAANPGGRRRALFVAGRIWRYWYLVRRPADGVTWLEQLIGDEPVGRAADRARAYHALGSLLAVDGQPEAAAAHLERALALWRDVDEPLGLLKTLISLGIAHQHRHRTDEAAACYDQAIAIARTLGETRQLDGVLQNRATLAHAVEEYDLALALLRERLTLLPPDARLERAIALVGIAAALDSLDRRPEARDTATEALALLAEGDPPRLLVLGEIVLGRADFYAGDLDGAERHFRRADEAARETRLLRFVGLAQVYLALVERRGRDEVGAAARYEEAVRLLAAAGAPGDLERARQAWEEAVGDAVDMAATG